MCSHLRRALEEMYRTTIPAFGEAMKCVRIYADEIDLERFLNVYDIYDVNEYDDFEPQLPNDSADQESLAFLRAQQHRLTSTRRLLLCCLLAIPATGTRDDATRWRSVVATMQKVNAVTATLYQELLLAQQAHDRKPNICHNPELHD